MLRNSDLLDPADSRGGNPSLETRQFDQVTKKDWRTRKHQHLHSVLGFHMQNDQTREITDYYHEFYEESPNRESWNYKRRGLLLAKNMFANNREWWSYAIASPKLNGRKVSFLMDTLQFIHTGKRALTVDNWRGLIEANPEPGKVNKGELKEITSLATLSTDELIALWCSQKGGFEDMICTLNLLFGIPHDYEALGFDV